MTLRLRNVQVDVPPGGYDAAVAFWAEALGATARRADEVFTHLVGPRSPVGVHLQRLGEGPARYHLDLEADDVAGEVARLEQLGATSLGVGACRTLTDPAGIVFCVCAGDGPAEQLATAPTDRARVRIIVVDVPSALVGDTVRFWAEALGASVERVPAPNDAFTFLAGVEGPEGEVGVLVQDTGEEGDGPRLHVDLHVPTPDDRDVEVDRLVALGATPVARHRHWAVLEAPSGHVLCVVPDRKDQT